MSKAIDGFLDKEVEGQWSPQHVEHAVDTFIRLQTKNSQPGVWFGTALQIFTAPHVFFNTT